MKVYGEMTITKIVDICSLPRWIQFWIIQIWWLITAWHHYFYTEAERAVGRKIGICCDCDELLERYLCL